MLQRQSPQVLCAMHLPSACLPGAVLKRCTQEKAHFEDRFAVGNAKVHYLEDSASWEKTSSSYRLDCQKLRDKGKKETRDL